ncbi:MAG: hypothetical protein WC465_04910 [Patescibacteria group bacterium]
MSDEFELPVAEQTETPDLSDAETADEANDEAIDSAEKSDEQTTESEKRDDLPEGVKKRFSKLTAEKYRAKAIIERQAEQLAQLTEYVKSINASETSNDVPDINAFVEQRAHEIVSEQGFNTKCNETFDRWSREFGDVSEAMADLSSVGLQRDVLEAIVESSESHRILQYLSNDLDRAEQLSRMKPIKAAKELDKIEAEIKNRSAKKSNVSKAPAPISDIRGKSTTTTPDLSKPENYFEWLNNARKR